MEKDIKAGEILGAVRKAFKLFQDFEHLHKVIAFLEQQEAYEAKLKASIHNLEIEHAELDEAITIKKTSLAEVSAKFEQAQNLLASTLANQAETRAQIVEAAEKEAEAIVSKARAEVSGMAERVISLQNQIKSLEGEIVVQEGALEDLRIKYGKEKDRIIKALNG